MAEKLKSLEIERAFLLLLLFNFLYFGFVAVSHSYLRRVRLYFHYKNHSNTPNSTFMFFILCCLNIKAYSYTWKEICFALFLIPKLLVRSLKRNIINKLIKQLMAGCVVVTQIFWTFFHVNCYSILFFSSFFLYFLQ